jgi:hypothetical protein
MVLVKIVASLLLTTLFAAGPRAPFQSPLESTARELLTNFVAGRFEAATMDFNDDLRPIVTPAILADVKSQLDREVGRFSLVKEAHQRQKDTFQAIELIARFEKAPVSVFVVFDPFGKVGAVYFNPIMPPVVDPALETVAREMLTNFLAGRYDDAAKPFDSKMRQELPPSGMGQLAGNIAGVFGTFRSVKEARQQVDQDNRIVDLILDYTKAPVDFRVTFDAQSRVTALRVGPFKP